MSVTGSPLRCLVMVFTMYGPRSRVFDPRRSTAVKVSSAYPTGLTEPEYNRLIDTDPSARRMSWSRMVRDAQVYARGDVRHRDHKTIHLDGWHRVYMNRERFAKHA